MVSASSPIAKFKMVAGKAGCRRIVRLYYINSLVRVLCVCTQLHTWFKVQSVVLNYPYLRQVLNLNYFTSTIIKYL
eukprot:SAG31_NODE_437_length_15714_cov_8.527344_5_plen_76_part_00